MRLKILILAALILSPVLSGQERLDFRYHDSLTYADYNNARWKELAASTAEAISLGHDYYYMRMRAGISYYERGRYLQAVKHFEKALEFSSNDQIALEYIYYCYLFTGKWWLANAISSGFGETAIRKTGIGTTNKNRASLNYFSSIYNNSELLDSYNTESEHPGPGSFYIPVKMMSLGLSLTHGLEPGKGIIHGFSYTRRTNSLYYSDGTRFVPEYSQYVNQYKYYFSLVFAGKKGLVFSPAAFYINSSYPIIEFITSGMGTSAYALRAKENNFGGGFSLTNNAGIFDFTASAYISRIAYINNFQAGLSLRIYPLANNYLYLGGGLSFISSGPTDGRSNIYVPEIEAGFSVRGRFYAAFNAMFGDIRNFVDYNGGVVYNGINKIDRVLSIEISVPAGKSGFYFFANASLGSEYTAFVPENYYYSTESQYSFNSISILGGLSWTF